MWPGVPKHSVFMLLEASFYTSLTTQVSEQRDRRKLAPTDRIRPEQTRFCQTDRIQPERTRFSQTDSTQPKRTNRPRQKPDTTRSGFSANRPDSAKRTC
ncbi:hypothetical protein ANANG_G00266180 [Anguilla anguilla]|uniref:Uncharacterized protein n=1 Tax=Anguilla anguilla TaxID=7936 RepID=A0A9D3LPQ8_ANGAN|nr:hypothetical protein ANANG_G00266180 [Anguilla anguilla]